MKIISSRPRKNVENDAMSNGLNQLHETPIDASVPLPVPTLMSATTANTSSMTSSMESRTFCNLADSSMPR